ncbi:hypothetical protein GSF70_15085 [Flavobacteriaceae bacterium W22]|nr:hypothetical protein [Flavobacteriaceae bacterium W22]
MLFVAIFIIILLLLTGIFFIFLLVISIRGFMKGDKSVGYFFLIVFLVFTLLLGYFLVTQKENKQILTHHEAKEILKREKIILKDSISILNYKYENDLYFYRLQFDVKISNNDYQFYSNKGLKDHIIQDYTKEEIQIHDTIKIHITNDKILHFYKCHFDTNN